MEIMLIKYFTMFNLSYTIYFLGKFLLELGGNNALIGKKLFTTCDVDKVHDIVE